MLSTISINRLAAARIPTDIGEFYLAVYGNDYDEKEHLAVIMGDLTGADEVLVRVHSECFTGDVLGSRRCDCGEQLQRALELIAIEGRGVILYLRQEGRGIGLAEKLRAYNLQDDGFDTVDANLALGHAADERDYTVAALMLKDLGVTSIRLITNNPDKIESLTELGLNVSQRVPTIARMLNHENLAYLRTKARRMRHLLNLNGLSLNGHPAENGRSPSTPKPSPVDLLLDVEKRARRRQLPIVTLSYAQSIDGAITARQGIPTPISGSASLKLTHRLRAVHDGILVGVGTVLSDDPRLSVRLVDGEHPVPIILDGQLRMPVHARLFDAPPFPLVATLVDASAEKAAALTRAGATVLRLPADSQGHVSLTHLLSLLYQRGMFSIMVEGGAQVIQSFLHRQMANQAIITVSLRFMGGYHVLNGAQTGMHLKKPQQIRLENDLIIWGKLQSPP